MNRDPLFVCNPKVPCPVCHGDRDRKLRKGCKPCDGSGYLPVNLNGLWAPSPAFLVCGGPSIKTMPVERLRERGIVSMGVNQVSAVVPVTAWTFGDPAEKFHHGLHLDPKTITFAPLGKLRTSLNAKLPDGQFRKIGMPDRKELCLRDCPGTFGYSRDSIFNPATFLTTTCAHWGGVPFDVPNIKLGSVQPGQIGAACSRCGEAAIRPDQRSLSCSNCGGHYELNKKGDEFEYQHEKTYVLASMMLGFRLLHYLGCPRIYLLGVDLWMTDEQPYAFAQTKKARNGRYQDENLMLHEIRPVMEASGVEIFNCNPMSKCDAFPLVPFDDALKDCRGAVPKEPFDTDQWYEKSVAEAHIEANPQPLTLAEIAQIQQVQNQS